MKFTKNKGKKLNYKCYWCYHVFQFRPTSWEGNHPMPNIIAKHKGCGSTSVQCPNCRRLIPTYSKESTENVVGRKHIHRTFWNSHQMLFGERIVPLEVGK